MENHCSKRIYSLIIIIPYVINTRTYKHAHTHTCGYVQINNNCKIRHFHCSMNVNQCLMLYSNAATMLLSVVCCVENVIVWENNNYTFEKFQLQLFNSLLSIRYAQTEWFISIISFTYSFLRCSFQNFTCFLVNLKTYRTLVTIILVNPKRIKQKNCSEQLH